MITAIVGSPSRTNLLLAEGWRALGLDAQVLWPGDADVRLDRGDVALMRLDILPTLDGVEPGLEVGEELERRGVRVLNRPDALLATHDKLVTARALAKAGVPHPAVVHVAPTGATDVPVPCVVKPRFGSWGQDVYLCRTHDELKATLRAVSERGWFVRHGALAQEIAALAGSDLRLVVAGPEVVAAAERRAAPGEWRTNVSLGGRAWPTSPPDDARELAIRAAEVIGIDLAGVDLMHTDHGWTVLELNGAVDFDWNYAIDGRDPFKAIAGALGLMVLIQTQPTTPRTEEAMTKTVKGRTPQPGDEIVITGHAVGDAPRTALILEALGDPGHERYHVRWEDGHESIYFPADDAIVRPHDAHKKTRARVSR